MSEEQHQNSSVPLDTDSKNQLNDNTTDLASREGLDTTGSIEPLDVRLNFATFEDEDSDEELFEPSLDEDYLAEQGEEQASNQTAEGFDAESAVINRNFKPIPPGKIKKAKRTKRILITYIVLFLLVLCGGVVAGGYYYINFIQADRTPAQDPIAIVIEGNGLEDRGVTESIATPNLAQMFGLTPDEVLATLGSDYAITKTDSDVTGQTGSGDAGNDTIALQVVTISYTPEGQGGTIGLQQNQKIYLSLGAQGTTIEVYFVSSMELLDFPISRFADLIASKDSFVQTLASAGATVSPELAYQAPTPQEFTEFVDKDANFKKIKKETATWKGALASAAPPTSFEITYTFDYGASGVEDLPDKHPLQRTVYIKLS